MAQPNPQLRINQLAKDFSLKSKELIDVFENAGLEGKTHMATLTPEEFGLLVWTLTEKRQIENIDDYLDGLVKITTKAEAEKEAAREEAEAKVKREAEEKEAARRKAEEEERARKEAQKTERDKSRPENRTAADRFEQRRAAQIPQQPAAKKDAGRQQPNQNAGQNQNRQKPQRPTQQPVRPTQPTGPREQIEVKQKNRVVDTRGGDSHVDLSRYDERFGSFVADNKKAAAIPERQKLKKQDNRSTYSKNREKERLAMERMKKLHAESMRKKQHLEVEIGDTITVSELASRLKQTAANVIKKLMTMGFMATINQELDFETAALVAEEFGAKVKREVVVSIEDRLFSEAEDDEASLVERAPVVCVMGHVDHGKTSLLDAIRNTHVTAGEAGGITQHIGAYRVEVHGKPITFLDTPGHAAFTAMRARGAQATDIAVLVVAADDGIMPQTVEAINHAKAAGVEIIVAINKMDKHGANPDAIKQELTKYDLLPEEWGGDTICIPVSALTHQGIDELLESILLVAEVKEYRANPNRRAKGVVIEAKLDRGRGPVATVLVQNGTLHAGDIVIAGTSVGRVRAMTDHNGALLREAGPSVPVEIIGLAEVPEAGDEFNAVEDEKMARTLAEQRRTSAKEEQFKENSRVSLDALFTRISEGVKDLNIIVKADVGGSAEAVKASLVKLSNEEVKVNVIHSAVGGITEGDVSFAAASGAIIIGFNVRPDKAALDSAERQNVEIRTYRVIYECIEEIEAAMKGMLAPKYREVVLGHAQVRKTIHVPNVGTIAGSYVQDGKVSRNAMIRVVRDSIVIFEDKISSLKRFKDDAREVNSGYECGIGLEKFNDIKENDILEAYVMEEIER
ncbi:MAG: translation initiation factor IF-2 [Eubacteriales bacterium]